MPTSSFNIIPAVMGAFRRTKNVQSVLDVGTGFGKYGILIREHLDIRLKRYDKKDWRTVIDAVEIWPSYINPIHQFIYNCIYIGDAVVVANRIKSYDVILLLEVIEHLPKRRGKKLIKLLHEKCNKALIISFPQIYQEGACGDWSNPFEEHKCLWTFEELKELIPNIEMVTKTVFHAYKPDQ